jgi:hypothetical protein
MFESFIVEMQSTAIAAHKSKMTSGYNGAENK